MGNKRDILFVGQYKGNNGPCNVNREYIRALTQSFDYIKSSNKVSKTMEIFFKAIRSKMLVISGICMDNIISLRVFKLFNKKVIYIMHGCVEFETDIDNLPNNEKNVDYEREVLKKSDLILAVSEKYMDWVKTRFPEYGYKIDYLNNGVIERTPNHSNNRKVSGRIIAVGGDRNIKNNVVISKAVELLDGKVELNIYGHMYHQDVFNKYHHTRVMGLVSQNELFKRMEEAELFILNSVRESFGLAVFDALNCGCSVLLSDRVGATGLLCLSDDDLIFNPMDERELAEKITKVMEKPNNNRIINSIDYSRLSYDQQVDKLESFCYKIMS